MKVLIIVSSIYGNGGTERAVSNLVDLLSTEYEFQIVSVAGSNGRPLPYNYSCPVIDLNLPELQKSLLGKIGWYRKVIKVVKETVSQIAPDIILGYGHNINFMLPFVASGKVRTYGCEHINFFTIPKFNRMLMRLTYPKLSGLIVLSEIAKSKMTKLNKNIIIIPNSLSFGDVSRSSLNLNKVVMVGRLSPEKGYDRLPQIVKQVIKTLPNLKIHIFGDGDQLSKLKDLYQRQDLDDYIILEGRTNDLISVYSDACMLLMTSYSEALPMAILEAKSFGIPTIGYDCEGTRNLINDSIDGYLIKNDDSQDFANKIVDLLTNATKMNSFSNAALEDVKKYSKESIKTKWIRLFNSSI